MSAHDIKIRCTMYQKRLIKNRARDNNMNMSEFIRDITTTGVWDFSGQLCTHKNKKLAIKKTIKKLTAELKELENK